MSALNQMNQMVKMFTGLTIEQSVNLQIGVKDWTDSELVKAIHQCDENDSGERMIYIAEQLRRETKGDR